MAGAQVQHDAAQAMSCRTPACWRVAREPLTRILRSGICGRVRLGLSTPRADPVCSGGKCMAPCIAIAERKVRAAPLAALLARLSRSLYSTVVSSINSVNIPLISKITEHLRIIPLGNKIFQPETFRFYCPIHAALRNQTATS
jgi:hypothetical protein